jgi:hypothetical protein
VFGFPKTYISTHHVQCVGHDFIQPFFVWKTTVSTVMHKVESDTR